LRADCWRNLPVLKVLRDFLVGRGERCAVVILSFVALAISCWHNFSRCQQRQNNHGQRASNERQPSPVCTENLIRVDDVMESPKLAE
jgi:hypothetical protein